MAAQEVHHGPVRREVLVVGRTRPSPPHLLRLLAPVRIGILLHRIKPRRRRGLLVAANDPAPVDHAVQEGRDAALGQLEFEHDVVKRGRDGLGQLPDDSASSRRSPPRRTGNDPVHPLDVAHPLPADGMATSLDPWRGVQGLPATPAQSRLGHLLRTPRPSAVLASQAAVLVLDVHGRFNEARVWHYPISDSARSSADRMSILPTM